VTSRTRHVTDGGGFLAPNQSLAKCSGAKSHRMPFLGGRRALSGVPGGILAYSPNPSAPARLCAKSGSRFPPTLPGTAIVPREGGNHGAISGVFCAEKVPNRYMFGTHLAVNI
jgi:hypothetical protein